MHVASWINIYLNDEGKKKNKLTAHSLSQLKHA